jgi:hypothetical protein
VPPILAIDALNQLLRIFLLHNNQNTPGRSLGKVIDVSLRDNGGPRQSAIEVGPTSWPNSSYNNTF